MVELSDERKAQIRAEEQARAAGLAEEAYRAQVRAELAADGAEAPQASAERPARPSSAQGASARPWGWAAVACLAVGAGLMALALALGLTTAGPASPPMVGAAGGDVDFVADVEIEAAATGAPAPVDTGPWAAIDLSPEHWTVDDTGGVIASPGPARTTLEDLVREAAEPPPVRRARPVASPRATASVWSAALGDVPADAYLVVGIDLAQVRASTTLSATLAAYVRDARLDNALDPLRTVGGFDVIGTGRRVLVALNPDHDTSSDNFLVAIEGDYDEQQILRFLKQISDTVTLATGSDGPYWRIKGGAVALRDRRLVAAATPVFEKAQLARAGASMLATGPLGPVVRGAYDAESFVALRLRSTERAELAAALPDLAAAESLALRVTGTGPLRLAATLAFPDAAGASTAAAKLTALLEMALLLHDDPELTDALRPIRASATGSDLLVRARLTDAQAGRILQLLEDL